MKNNAKKTTSQVIVSAEFEKAFIDENGNNWLRAIGASRKSPLDRFLARRVVGCPTELLPEHVEPFLYIVNTGYGNETWDDAVKAVTDKLQTAEKANSCACPRWNGKADRPTVFCSDFGLATSATTRDAIDNELQRITIPVLKEIETSSSLVLIVTAVLRCIDIFAPPCGKSIAETDEKEQWRWARPISILAGFGFLGFRVFAEELAKTTGSSFWAECALADDNQLVSIFKTAWQQSGYPLGLICLDYVTFRRLLMQEIQSNKDAEIPWLPLKLLLFLHIFKHARLRTKPDGKRYVEVAYRGRWECISVSDDGLKQSLYDTANQHLLRALDTVLELRLEIGGKTPSDLAKAVRGMLKDMTVEMIPEPESIENRTDLLVGPTVLRSRIHDDGEPHFICTDRMISNIAQIDSTGKINKNATVCGADVLSYSFPIEPSTEEDVAEFRATTPDQVFAERPSAVIRRHIRNINDLGFREELDAMIDGNACGGLLRRKLTGSQTGLALKSEYALVFVLPADAKDEDSTTNQGKTNLALQLGAINTPTIEVVSASTPGGPPATREIFHGIRKSGTAVIDDFKPVPPGRGLPFDPQSLQTLSCGHIYAPGIANENGTGIRLEQSLYFVAKYLKAPSDIHNRAFVIHLNELTPETRCTDKELSMITSGMLSKIARISALLYIDKYNLVETLRSMDCVGGDVHRFFGHATIMAHFLGGKVDGLKAFFTATKEHCLAQCAAGHDGNLDEAIGDTDNGFDARWYYDNAREETMVDLYVNANTRDVLSPREALQKLVQNTQLEPQRVMRTESSCVKKFTNSIKSNRYKWEHPHGWIMELVPKTVSDKKVNGKAVAYIKVYHSEKSREEIFEPRKPHSVPIVATEHGPATREAGA